MYKEGKVQQISANEGLYSELTNRVVVENDSVIWVCTSHGVNRIIFSKQGSYKIDGVSEADGLISDEVKDVEVIGDSVWVGTPQGLVVFHKKVLSEIHKTNNFYLKITSLMVNDKAREKEDLVSLDYQENRLDIDFLAVSYKYNQYLEYRYRLNGLESEWNYSTNRHASYSFLEPGQYCIELQVRGQNSEWAQNAIIFPVIISPPFYATWWFQLLAGLIVLLFIYLFFRVNILSYNRHVTRELLRYLLRNVRKRELQITVRENGMAVKIPTASICYVKSSGNYLEIHTGEKVHLIRAKLSAFINYTYRCVFC